MIRAQLLLFVLLLTACSTQPVFTDAQKRENSSYYQGMREKIEPAYQGSLRGLLPPDEKILKASVVFSLDAQGKVQDVELRDKTEFEKMDAAILAALRGISTFGTPPAALLDENGATKILFYLVTE